MQYALMDQLHKQEFNSFLTNVFSNVMWAHLRSCDQLHEQEFNSLLANFLSNVMWAHLCSCVGLAARVWFLVHPNTSSFYLSFAHFFTTFHIRFDISHPIVSHLSQCQCGYTINDLGIYLLCCPCGNERIVAHDTLWDIVVTITSESWAHVQKEVSHLFPYHTQ
jgi:hypothetical protein